MNMYRKCLACGREFASNDALEHLDRGRRVAYDPSRGRLWLVCRACSGWSLLPMESRWEALDELEKVVTDQGRLLSRTDNVALLRAGPLEVVRVGGAELREEAWWRYGRELRRRRERYRKLSTAGTVAAAATIAGSWATGGISFVAAWLAWDRIPGLVTGGARLLRFGRTAWRGHGRCERCNRPAYRIRYAHGKDLVLRGAAESVEVRVFCRHCEMPGGGFLLRGQEADRTLRRVLAYHEERERRLLSMEVAELEAHWRREEELARIMDGELTFLPGGARRM